MYKSFIEEIFQTTEVTKEDLERYFETERDETLFLEFKSFVDKDVNNREKELRDAEKIKGVIKTIDAFLNSNGGLLIWGAPESVEVNRGKKKIKVCQGTLCPVPTFYDRDAFVNKIASQIRPLPQGVRMQSIQVEKGYIYLFEVPESQNKPHQFDGRYYIRLDTNTSIAEHYLVHAMCRQIKNPELSIKVTLGNGRMRTNEPKRFISFTLFVNIENTVEGINDYDIYIKSHITNDGQFGKFRQDRGHTALFEDVSKILSFGLPVEFDFDVFVNVPVIPEPIITIWYGGRNSLVKKVSFKVKFNLNEDTYTQNLTFYHTIAEYID
ncbi:AlbA family DNA-binding domain-containing protein [Spirosoma linguale]|uniref:Transcriptional regulator n=1 Tax=Spirosoma linguale (strain ATCC 33905 / DSM 74 / LMG 10896 / Claus 1) TaxID=504472 RepID=D2QSP4_SPILD|nr:putative transcriptional regulator [Spirosoma linguale DSM 74]